MIKRGVYQHYKGNSYEVLEVARHSETEELYVVYQQLYGTNGVWIRPYSMFVETVTVNGKTMQRFKYQSSSK